MTTLCQVPLLVVTGLWVLAIIHSASLYATVYGMFSGAILELTTTVASSLQDGMQVSLRLCVLGVSNKPWSVSWPFLFVGIAPSGDHQSVQHSSTKPIGNHLPLGIIPVPRYNKQHLPIVRTKRAEDTMRKHTLPQATQKASWGSL